MGATAYATVDVGGPNEEVAFPMSDKLLHEVSEASVLTSLGRSKLYELMATGQIESVKVGRRRLIPHEALVSFVSRLRQEAS